MRLTGAIQEGLLALLCFDEEYSALVADLVPYAHYDLIFSDVASDAIDYIREYKQPPIDHTWDIFEALINRNEEKEELYIRLFESIKGTYEDVNADYVLKQARAFMQYQRVKRGIAKAATALQRETADGLADAELALRGSLEDVGNIFDPGTRLTDIDSALAYMHDQSQTMPTGIPELDRFNLGPARKRLHILIGVKKHGKSWWLLHLARMALKHRRKVIYVTLELSEQEVQLRFLQSIFAISKREGERIKTAGFQKDDRGKLISFDINEIKSKRSFASEGIGAFLRSRKAVLRRRNLWIREFPTGRLTLSELEAYLGALEAQHKFTPDLLIVDYADLMTGTSNTSEKRHELDSIYVGLRGIAVDRNIAVATVSQANRTGGQSKLLTSAHLAEHYGKAAIADTVLTLNKTSAEYDCNLARIYVDAARGDADHFQVLVSQSYATGQFVRDSVRMSSDYFSKLESVYEGEK